MLLDNAYLRRRPHMQKYTLVYQGDENRTIYEIDLQSPNSIT